MAFWIFSPSQGVHLQDVHDLPHISGEYKTLMIVTGVSLEEGYDLAVMKAIDGQEVDFGLYENDHDTTQMVDLTNSNQSCQNWNNYPLALG